MAFSKLMWIMMGFKFSRNMLVLGSVTVSWTVFLLTVPLRERMSRPQGSEHAPSPNQCRQVFLDSVDVF